jgi:hypothetical protein
MGMSVIFITLQTRPLTISFLCVNHIAYNLVLIIHLEYTPTTNRIGCVMDSVLASGALDYGFESQSAQSKDYKIVYMYLLLLR